MLFTFEEIAEIVETPLGDLGPRRDDVIGRERRAIRERYEELQVTPVHRPVEWCRARNIKSPPEGREVILGFYECSVAARAWWLRERSGLVPRGPEESSCDVS